MRIDKKSFLNEEQIFESNFGDKKGKYILKAVFGCLVFVCGAYSIQTVSLVNEKTNSYYAKEISTVKVEKKKQVNKHISDEVKSVVALATEKTSEAKFESEESQSIAASTNQQMQTTTVSSNYQATSTKTYYATSDGKLNSFNGVYYGPSGKETYYNLNMSTVVSYMREQGNNDTYWVREDGAKMLGDYVMVAADLSTYSKGDIVDTSLGQGIVVDTGSFTTDGSGTKFDIATDW